MLSFSLRRKMAARAPRDQAPTLRIKEDEREQPYLDTALATHLGTRTVQQDAVYVSEPIYEPGRGVGVLCDGMGGMEAGERVSADAVEFLATRLLTLPLQTEIPATLEHMVRDANEMVLARYLQAGCESGTTAVSAVVLNDKLYWASVGDSRIYLIRHGEIACVTRDHNYALQLQRLVDAGRMRQEEADADPRRETLISYLGAPVLEMVDVSAAPFLLLPGDLVLLCSDGLTKSLSDAQILQLLAPLQAPLCEAARRLTVAAFDQSSGAQDNTSVVLLHYLGPTGKATPKATNVIKKE